MLHILQYLLLVHPSRLGHLNERDDNGIVTAKHTYKDPEALLDTYTDAINGKTYYYYDDAGRVLSIQKEAISGGQELTNDFDYEVGRLIKLKSGDVENDVKYGQKGLVEGIAINGQVTPIVTNTAELSSDGGTIVKTVYCGGHGSGQYIEKLITDKYGRCRQIQAGSRIISRRKVQCYL